MTTLKQRAIARVIADSRLFSNCTHLRAKTKPHHRLHLPSMFVRRLERTLEILCGILSRWLFGLAGATLGLIIALPIMAVPTGAMILLLQPFPQDAANVIPFLQTQSLLSYFGWGFAWLCCAIAPYTLAGIPIYLAVSAAAVPARFFRKRADAHSFDWENNAPQPTERWRMNPTLAPHCPAPIVLRWLLEATGIVLALLSGVGGLFAIGVITLKMFSGSAAKDTMTALVLLFMVGCILISILAQVYKSMLGALIAVRFYTHLFEEDGYKTAFSEAYRDS